MARITKQTLTDALDFVRKEADAHDLHARECRQADREKEAEFYSGKALGMRVAARAIENKLLA